MQWLEGAIRVGLGDLPGEVIHEQGFDRDHYGWERSSVAYDKYTLTMEDGRLEVYVGTHPVQVLHEGEPFEELQVNGHRGLSRRVVRLYETFREIFFVPSFWVRVFYEARTDEATALLDRAIADLQIDAGGELAQRARVEGKRGFFSRKKADEIVPVRDLVALPGGRWSRPFETSTDGLDYGNVIVGESLSIPLQLLGGGQVVSAECPDGYFAYDRGGSRFADSLLDLPFRLHGAKDITITFRPQKQGPSAGEVRFQTHDGHRASVKVAAMATSGDALPFQDNESLIELDAFELPPKVDKSNPRAIHSVSELDFGKVNLGDRRERALYMRNLDGRPVPVAFGGTPELGAEGRSWFWVDFGKDAERVNNSGVIWIGAREELRLTIHCHCRRNALLAPHSSLAIGTPSGTQWISLLFRYGDEVAVHTCRRGWGYGDIDYAAKGVLALLDPDLDQQIQLRMPAPAEQ